MNNLTSIKILYILSQFFFYLSLIGIGICLVLSILFSINRPSNLKLGVPVDVKFVQPISFESSSNAHPAELEFSKGSVEVPFRLLNTGPILLMFGIAIALLTVIAAIFYYFRSFMKYVTHNQTFELIAIKHLKRMAIGLVILHITGFVAQNFANAFVSSNFNLGEASLKISIDIISPLLLAALFLWVIAHILQRGRELEDEQKLTI